MIRRSSPHDSRRLARGFGLTAALFGAVACGPSPSSPDPSLQSVQNAPTPDPLSGIPSDWFESSGSGRKKLTLMGRPIIEKDGKSLVWAGGDEQTGDAEWFDMTDALIDPAQLNHGLGKDAIAAIDRPVFVEPDDPRLSKAGITDRSEVIGFVRDGEARAYPIDILNEHEVVNDRFGNTPVTVGW